MYLKIYFFGLFVTLFTYNCSTAADLDKIKEDAYIMGYCLYCAESLDINPDTDEDMKFASKIAPIDESMLDGLSDDNKKIAEGKEIIMTMNENVHAGKAAAEALKGARCKEMIPKIIAMYKAMGLEGSTWIAINEKFQTDNSDVKNKKLNTGIYKYEGDEIVNIVLNTDKTGYETILAFEDNTAPFIWKISGDKLIIDYQNENNTKKAKILSPSSFVLEDRNFTIDPSASIDNFAYSEDGYGGNLKISDFGEAGIIFEAETINNSTASTCEVKADCSEKSGKLICRDPDNPDPDGIIILQRTADNLTLETTLPVGDYCGNGGNFTGKYKFIR